MDNSPLSGSIRILFVCDVCEEIRMEQLRGLIGGEQQGDVVEQRREPASPEYVRFERPPVIQQLGLVTLGSGERLTGEVNYYEYGAVSLKLEVAFAVAGWQELVALSGNWLTHPRLEGEAQKLVRECLQRVQPALLRPTHEWVTEDYYIIHLHNEAQANGAFRFCASEVIAQHGGEIARMVRGELSALSEAEEREILGSQMSYYPQDVLVVGWTAAFLCDTTEGAVSTVQLLEYANTQLLEFRYYDGVLTRVLGNVSGLLDQRGGFFGRWALAREAQNLNKMRLDIRDLTERMDTSIKFLSDMFSARQYRMAATKIGVDDYRRLVEAKLRTAGDLYTFMMDQFHASRSFVLELMVVIILIIDLVFLVLEQFRP